MQAAPPYSGEEPIRPLPLEVTFNGDDAAGSITASGVPYQYYEPASLEVGRVFPLGGPADGGTDVAVYLTDDRLLVDLGGGNGGGGLGGGGVPRSDSRRCVGHPVGDGTSRRDAGDRV